MDDKKRPRFPEALGRSHQPTDNYFRVTDKNFFVKRLFGNWGIDLSDNPWLPRNLRGRDSNPHSPIIGRLSYRLDDPASPTLHTERGQ